MKVVTEEELAAKLDFMRPLHPAPEERSSVWCIPFEYGSCEKGTCISIAKAKEISAELRAAVAEEEKRELRRAFEDERDANADLKARLAKAELAMYDAKGQLEHHLREARRRARAKR